MKQCSGCKNSITGRGKSSFCRWCAVKGKRNPFYGKKHSNESKNLIGKKAKERGINGKNNPNWREQSKGKYQALHLWLRSRKPKIQFCEHCKVKPPRDLANISQIYKKTIDDYIWLCKSCHMKMDAKFNKKKRVFGFKAKDIVTG